MEQWIEFAKEEWLILLIALVALIIVIKIVKTVFKWLIVIAIIVGVIYYGANYTDQIQDVTGKLLSYAKEEAFEVMAGEATNARYSVEPDGTYKVESSRITIQGEKNAGEVKVTFKGQSFTFKLNDAIQSYIEQAKKNEGI